MLAHLGLPMRVTEKIMNNSAITILEHTPCRVYGWDLHPADRVRIDNGQRFLHCRPLCIYVRFDKAEWQVGKLPPGVFPLFPCERTWGVSKEPKVSIVRKGFTLIPDYASTAFMMQGCSLEAAIAERGDEFQAGGLSEMMTTYVILSRVKKADSLLPPRAFSRDLFRMGMAPGPYCLLKLLRHRFGLASDTGETQDKKYEKDEATAEYDERVAALKRHLALRRQRDVL